MKELRAEIISKLAEIAVKEAEMISSGEKKTFPLEKTGSFIIERRQMADLSIGIPTSSICARVHSIYDAFPTHSHDFIELMYVCSGSITHVLENETVCLHADEMILLGRDTKHSILKAEQNDIGINLIISVDLFESLFYTMRSNSYLKGQVLEGLFRKNGTPYLVFSAKENIAVRNLIEGMIATVMIERNTDGYLLQQSLSLLLSHLASMSEQEPLGTSDSKETLKKRLLNYIHTTYSTATLTEAADMFGLSVPYLSRLVCESFGETFKELLLRERFAAACELLCTTNMPIGDIIHRIGYENSSYFHKEFKNRYDMTPKQYRKNHRKMP